MEYYGQLSIDRIIHQKYFFKKEKGTYVECGAFDGIMESNTLALYKYKNWNGFNIDNVVPNGILWISNHNLDLKRIL